MPFACMGFTLPIYLLQNMHQNYVTVNAVQTRSSNTIDHLKEVYVTDKNKQQIINHYDHSG